MLAECQVLTIRNITACTWLVTDSDAIEIHAKGDTMSNLYNVVPTPVNNSRLCDAVTITGTIDPNINFSTDGTALDKVYVVAHPVIVSRIVMEVF